MKKINGLVLVLIGIILFQLGFGLGKFVLVQTDAESLAERVGALEKQFDLYRNDWEMFKTKLDLRMKTMDEIIKEVDIVKDHIRKSGNLSEPQARSMALYLLWNVRHSGLEMKLALAAMMQESSCNPNVVGKDGERGPLQVLYQTFLQYGKGNFYDWRDTMAAGIRFMSELYRKTGGNKELTLAYYNAGPNLPSDRALQLAHLHIKKVMNYYQQL
jgi:hypothetical protein